MTKKEARRCPCQGGTLVRFVQPIILSVLYDNPCHGYVILQEIAKTRLWKAEAPDPAGVYRTLKDMENRGLITSRVDLKSLPGRRLYSLTDEGLACCENWIETLRQYCLGLNEIIAMLGREHESPI